MNLIVGLGNPGEKYTQTRHNIGFAAIEALVKKRGLSTGFKIKKEMGAEVLVNGAKLIFAKPQTFMNSSGYAVAKVARFYKIDPKDIWVIHDDVDLPLGHIKIRLGGGAAGHHGVESVIRELGTDQFIRFRLGIEHPAKNPMSKFQNTRRVERYVLEEFVSSERSAVKSMIKNVNAAIETALEKGIDTAMNRFNPPPPTT